MSDRYPRPGCEQECQGTADVAATYSMSLPAHDHRKMAGNPKSPMSSFSSASSQRITDSFVSPMCARDSQNSCSMDTNISYPAASRANASAFTYHQHAISGANLHTAALPAEDEEEDVRLSLSHHSVMSADTKHRDETSNPVTIRDRTTWCSATDSGVRMDKDGFPASVKKVTNTLACTTDYAKTAHSTRRSGGTHMPSAHSHRPSSHTDTSSPHSSFQTGQPTFVCEYVYHPDASTAVPLCLQEAHEYHLQQQLQQQRGSGEVSYVDPLLRGPLLTPCSSCTDIMVSTSHTNLTHRDMVMLPPPHHEADGSHDSAAAAAHLTRRGSMEDSITLTPSTTRLSTRDTSVPTRRHRYVRGMRQLDTLTARADRLLHRRQSEAAVLRQEHKELEQHVRGYEDRTRALRLDTRQLASAVHTREELEMLVYMYADCVARVATLQSRRRDLEQMSAQLHLLCVSVESEEGEKKKESSSSSSEEGCSDTSAIVKATSTCSADKNKNNDDLDATDESRWSSCVRRGRRVEEECAASPPVILSSGDEDTRATPDASLTKSLSPNSRAVFGDFLSDLLSEVEMLSKICIQLPSSSTSSPERKSCANRTRLCARENEEEEKLREKQQALEHEQAHSAMGSGAGGGGGGGGGFYTFFGGATEEHLSAKPLSTFLACATRLNRHAWELEEELQLRARELDDEKGEESLRQRLAVIAAGAPSLFGSSDASAGTAAGATACESSMLLPTPSSSLHDTADTSHFGLTTPPPSPMMPTWTDTSLCESGSEGGHDAHKERDRPLAALRVGAAGGRAGKETKEAASSTCVGGGGRSFDDAPRTSAAAAAAAAASFVSLPARLTMPGAHTKQHDVALPPIHHYAHPRLMAVSRQLDEQQLLLQQRYRGEGARLREERRALVQAMRASYRAHEGASLRVCTSALRARQRALARALTACGVVCVTLRWRDRAAVSLLSPSSDANAAALRADSVERRLRQWCAEEDAAQAEGPLHDGAGVATAERQQGKTVYTTHASRHMHRRLCEPGGGGSQDVTCIDAAVWRGGGGGAHVRHGAARDDIAANLLVPPPVHTPAHMTTSLSPRPSESSRPSRSHSMNSSSNSSRRSSSSSSHDDAVVHRDTYSYTHAHGPHARSHDTIRQVVIEMRAAPVSSTTTIKTATTTASGQASSLNDTCATSGARSEKQSIPGTPSSASMHSSSPYDAIAEQCPLQPSAASASASAVLLSSYATSSPLTSHCSSRRENGEREENARGSTWTPSHLTGSLVPAADMSGAPALHTAESSSALSARSSISFVEEEDNEVTLVRPTVLRSCVPRSRLRRRTTAAASAASLESNSDDEDEEEEAENAKISRTNRDEDGDDDDDEGGVHDGAASADEVGRGTRSTISFLQQSDVDSQDTRVSSLGRWLASDAAEASHSLSEASGREKKLHAKRHSEGDPRRQSRSVSSSVSSYNSRHTSHTRTQHRTRSSAHGPQQQQQQQQQHAPVWVRVTQSRTPVTTAWLPATMSGTADGAAPTPRTRHRRDMSYCGGAHAPLSAAQAASSALASRRQLTTLSWNAPHAGRGVDEGGAVHVSVRFGGAAAQRRREVAQREEQLGRVRWQLREELARLEEVNFVRRTEEVELEERYTAQRARNEARVREAATKMTEAKELLRSLTHEHKDWIATLTELQSLVKETTSEATASGEGRNEAS